MAENHIEQFVDSPPEGADLTGERETNYLRCIFSFDLQPSKSGCVVAPTPTTPLSSCHQSFMTAVCPLLVFLLFFLPLVAEGETVAVAAGFWSLRHLLGRFHFGTQLCLCVCNIFLLCSIQTEDLT